MKTPITKARLIQHWTYSWWKYVLLVALCLFGWNIVFTTTEYRPPEDKKVMTYIYAAGEEPAFKAYLDAVHEAEMSDMEQVGAYFMMLDETYGDMQLMTYMAAGEGDLYILPKEKYQSQAGQAFFVPLEDQPGIDAMTEQYPNVMERAWRKGGEDTDGQRHLYGLPLSAMPGFARYLYTGANEYYLCMAVNNQNDENTMKLLQILMRDMAQATEQQ